MIAWCKTQHGHAGRMTFRTEAGNQIFALASSCAIHCCTRLTHHNSSLCQCKPITVVGGSLVPGSPSRIYMYIVRCQAPLLDSESLTSTFSSSSCSS